MTYEEKWKKLMEFVQEAVDLGPDFIDASGEKAAEIKGAFFAYNRVCALMQELEEAK